MASDTKTVKPIDVVPQVVRRTIRPGDDLQIGRWRLHFPRLNHNLEIEFRDTIQGTGAQFAQQGKCAYLVGEGG
jgi:hypothetical protein